MKYIRQLYLPQRCKAAQNFKTARKTILQIKMHICTPNVPQIRQFIAPFRHLEFSKFAILAM